MANLNMSNTTFDDDVENWDKEESHLKFEARENDLDMVETTIILIITFLLQTFGNAMLVGMISYEMNGNGDPLKRRIIDQVRLRKQIIYVVTSRYQFFNHFLKAFHPWILLDVINEPNSNKHAVMVSLDQMGFQCKPCLRCSFHGENVCRFLCHGGH